VKLVCLLLTTAAAMIVVASASPVGTTTCLYRQGTVLPDATCTPGATNPAVTPATIKSTICVVGWTSTIRPPQSVADPEKTVSMQQYGVTNKSLYEYDHLIPLEVGGAPNSTLNLWPESHATSFVKDGIENGLKKEVCDGAATLSAAQYWMSHDWTKIVLGKPLPPIPVNPTPICLAVKP
jgi:hypothetical protein